MGKAKCNKKGTCGRWKPCVLPIVVMVLSFIISIGTLGTCTKNAYMSWKYKTLESTAYSIAALDEAGTVKESTTSLCTKESIKTKGLRCELKAGAQIRYQLFFYDSAGAFIGSTESLSINFNHTDVPGNATSVRVMITPTADEDGEITIFEKGGYAEQLEITVKR